MIARVAKALNEKEKGFTLVELLVVIVIIGILSAIAIPQFLKYREGAWKKSVESDVTQTRTAVEGYTITNSGKIPAASFTLDNTGSNNATAQTGIDFLGSKGNSITYTPGTGNTYTITGFNENISSEVYTYSSTTGKGSWGAAPAVTPTP